VQSGISKVRLSEADAPDLVEVRECYKHSCAARTSEDSKVGDSGGRLSDRGQPPWTSSRWNRGEQVFGTFEDCRSEFVEEARLRVVLDPSLRTEAWPLFFQALRFQPF
jgi:hypothetical protein